MRTRTARPKVSYREDDFEEERGDENFENSDDEDQIAVAGTSAPRQRRQRPVKEPHVPKTRHHPRVSYTEVSSEDEDRGQYEENTDSEVSLEPEPRKAPNAGTRKRPGRPPASKLSKPAKSIRATRKEPSPQKPESHTTLRIGAPRKAIQPRSAPTPPIVSEGRIPQWHTLPYEILRSIFAYSIKPLIHVTGRVMQTLPDGETTYAKWLIDVACLCQAFTEPALHVLYTCPPIDSTVRGNALRQLLQSSSHKATKLSYHTKIRKIKAELSAIGPGRSSDAAGQAMMRALLTTPDILPLLREIEIWDRDDQESTKIPGQQSSRAVYPLELLNQLASGDRKLSAWHWHGPCLQRTANVLQTSGDSMTHFSLAREEHEILNMVHKSQRPSLQSLKFAYFDNLFFSFGKDTKALQGLEPDLTLYHNLLDSTFLREKTEAGYIGPSLAQGVSQIETLRSLKFHACVMRMSFLQAINRPLTRLRLENCNGVRSEGLAIYLTSQGSQLEDLILEHNIDLDLGFLTVLESACPKLKVLKMDFRYISELMLTDMADPGYDRLLEADQIPTWPKTLQQLDLQHMRSWDAGAATVFFESLVKAAKDLPDLRRLAISASITMSWRDRATFRDSWISRLERVFLRKSAPPDPNLQSLLAYRLWKERKAKIDAGFIQEFSHVAVTPKKRLQIIVEDTEDEVDGSSGRKRRSTGGTRASRRIKDRRVSNETAPAAEPASSSLNLRDAVKMALEPHIQGLCDVVYISIDNSRPRENQLTEGNFLDEEPSDDDDYVMDGDVFTSDI